MILFWECVGTCIIFGTGITISILVNRTSWLQEYAPKVQERFLQCNPDFKLKEKKERGKGILIAKLIFSLGCLVLLAGLGILAGAEDFKAGFANSYIIWIVVNWFDVFALDLGLFMYWKKLRLPGTEDMDEEYKNNKWKHVRDGFYGMLIGIPISLLAAGMLVLLRGLF